MAPSATSTTKTKLPQIPRFLESTPAEIHEKYVDLEWQQRHRARQAKDAGSEWVCLQGDEVSKRNRYVNIDPYQANRVKLRVPDGMNDYINASPIVLRGKGGKERRYVATQGPMSTSTSHFWRMIWHETSSVAVILMLTQLLDEAGREKCFQYFPHDPAHATLHVNTSDEFRDGERATVTLVDSSYDEAARCTVRKLVMQQVAAPSGPGRQKTIYHLEFLGWPDFLVPEGADRLALFELIKLSERLNNLDGNGARNPRIVHCSAGIGRTGTLIALEHLLGELEDGALERVPDGEDRIVEVVEALRRQRMGMVQMEAQVRFLYGVLREAWGVRYGGGGVAR